MLTRYHRHKIVPDDGVCKCEINGSFILHDEFSDFDIHMLCLLNGWVQVCDAEV